MAYTKQTWTAPTGTGLSRYAKSGETETHVELALDPVNLTNTPTPITVARLNHMEEGIAKAYDTAPPTPWAQYSGKDIQQLPDNVAGTTQKVTEFTSASVPAGWTTSNAPSFELVGTKLKIIASERYSQIYRSIINLTSCVTIEEISGQWSYDGKIAVVGNNVAYKTSGTTVLHCNTTAGYVVLSSIYIGTGAYDRLVFDNSYHYRHLLNNAVIPTPQGLYFNGATSYLRSKEKLTLPDVFTFSATVNCAVKSVGQVLFAQGNYTATPFLWFYRYTSSNTLYIRGSDGTQAIGVQDVLNFFTGLDNTNIEVEVTFDFINKTVDLYRNKVKFGSTLSLGTMVKPVANNLYIGNSVTLNNSILGYMRNICLFDTALTDTQRNWLAQGNTPPILYDVTNYETEGYVSIQDADGTNTGVETDVDSNGNRILKLPATIKASITGNASTSDKWKTARNIRISDADGTNTGAAVSVDGSENETLKLPATIKANVSGNADTASNANVRVSLRHGDTWFAKTWTGLTDFSGSSIWTDGENIYYSYATSQFVLNKATSTWVVKTWTGLTGFYGNNIWTDGDNIYYSADAYQYVLNRATSTWVTKTWTGYPNFSADDIWTDGENIYSSNSIQHYVLDKATATWVPKTWAGSTSISGKNVWTDGENIYHSLLAQQYVLNRATSTWVSKTWAGYPSFHGERIWTDGENIYHSVATEQYVLNRATSTWVSKTWAGLTNFAGVNNWTDGENIYYSTSTNQYVLPATRHNYVDDAKYNPLLGKTIRCNCSTLSDRFVFRNE